jgi:hypothetical protein
MTTMIPERDPTRAWPITRQEENKHGESGGASGSAAA